ncbi:PhzF family phenazine biosynthesis protein [Salinithrix halophila]|uniref:PhzF family phenazine biosynthesis protein n=1 Tax=Salinithrix halophila TaxID=1485204 RepID=A0ABV8JIJ6_9BACL
MGQSIIQVNAFTNRPFTGNPAAVCILPNSREDRWMQQIAKEMNLPETAFLYEQPGGYRLRWFTPLEEEDLCGHATLATAHVLWEQERADPAQTLYFHTKSGLLTAHREGEWIVLDFPAEPIRLLPEIPAALKDRYGDIIKRAGSNRLDHFLELESETEVRRFNPEKALGTLPIHRGLIVSSQGDQGPYDIVSRFFAPNHGISEDPVTGSAHCALGPYWTELLAKDELLAFQASERGGTLRVRNRGNRVQLLGQAVTVWRGELAKA